jgi:phage shock protein PspC (stress-responsive transcriptional regulator)
MKRLYKVRQGRIVDGVCGGFADYIGIDAVWVRTGWALLCLAGGVGVIAYLLGMYLFPRADSGEERVAVSGQRSSRQLLGGLLLIGVGAIFVLRAVGVVHYGFWGLWHVAWWVLWPLSLIAGGLFLLFVYWRQGGTQRPSYSRSIGDRIILGVCGGLGQYFGIDANFLRFCFALVIVLSRGVALIAYVAVALLTPESRDEGQVS